MAFLFNLTMHFLTDKNYLNTIIVSFIVFFFYFIADDLANFSLVPNWFLNWALYDLATIVLITFSLKIFKQSFNSAAYYILIGLSCSTILFLTMHIDVEILGNKVAWFLWDVFSYGGTLIDLIMITALILNRDFLNAKSLMQNTRIKKSN
ncbi:hypothetical protein PALB_11080 [Pseudoalteromonas luteoviolacea B = ATCC 29581]|nr:hypothetical protein PALB_11080 [Pseudoalteromonas luteoviolacea B = ATCC 29581]